MTTDILIDILPEEFSPASGPRYLDPDKGLTANQYSIIVYLSCIPINDLDEYCSQITRDDAMAIYVHLIRAVALAKGPAIMRLVVIRNAVRRRLHNVR